MSGGRWRASRGVLLALALSTWTATATAQDALADAERAYAAGRIDEARASYERALAEGRSRDELHRIHLQLGVLHAVTGDREAARAAFAIALALRPDAEPPAELDPTTQAEFRALRTEARAIEVLVEPVGEVSRDAPTVLRLRVDHPLASLASRVRVRAEPPGAPPWTSTVALEEAGTEVALPPMAWRASDQLEVTVDALDAHGGVLATAQRSLRHTPATPIVLVEPPVAPAAPRSVPIVEEPWFWVVTGLGVAALAALTVGLAVGLGQDVYPLGTVRVLD